MSSSCSTSFGVGGGGGSRVRFMSLSNASRVTPGVGDGAPSVVGA